MWINQFILICLFISMPFSFIQANTVKTQFYTDNVGRVYHSPSDFSLKIISATCIPSSSLFSLQSIVPVAKGIERFEFMNVQEDTLTSHTQGVLENFLKLHIGHDSMNNSYILFNIHKKIPPNTKTIGMFLKGTYSNDVLVFVLKGLNNKSYHYTLKGFQHDDAEFFTIPINNQKDLTLDKILYIHHAKQNLAGDTIVMLGEIHFLSYEAPNRGAFFKDVPSDDKIDVKDFNKEEVKRNGEPYNISYAIKQSHEWKSNQNLMININTEIEGTLEIYAVLRDRMKQAFMLRVFIPKGNEQCIQIQLPANVVYYNENRYHNDTFFFHGFKFIPTRSPLQNINILASIFFKTREN